MYWKRQHANPSLHEVSQIKLDEPFLITIRTEFYKPEKGRYLHPVAHRPITHLEAALLQSFPENFEFCGRKISVGIQIGNAVPPLFALSLANHVASMLGPTNSKSINKIA